MAQTDDQQQPTQHRLIRDKDSRTGKSAAAARIANQQSWVDEQIRVAMERGDFDDLPGAGKPIEGLDDDAPGADWWVKKLVEREHIAILPPSLQLRKDDAELDARLDKLPVESEVRKEVEQFNERVIAARYSLQTGPPLITMPRDVDHTVEEWRGRWQARREAMAARVAADRAAAEARPRRRWWRRTT